MLKMDECIVDKHKCRLCLGDNSEVYIFDNKEQLVDKIHECCDYIVEENESIPDKICSECCKQLNMIVEFKFKCRRNETMLQKSLSKMKLSGDILIDQYGMTKIEFEDSMTFFNVESDFSVDDTGSDTTVLLEKTEPKQTVDSIPNSNTSEIVQVVNNDQVYEPAQNFYTNSNKNLIENKSHITIKKRKYNISKERQMRNFCEICQKILINAREFERHMSTYHNKKVTCELCGKQVAHKMSLRSHISICHTKKNMTTCDHCGKTFKGKIDCKKHMAQVHDRSTIVECDVCAKKFVTKKSLKRHIEVVHNQIHKQKCNLCDKVLTSLSGLRLHLRIHTGEKPYKCELCESAFRDPTTLKYHRSTHTGETPYRCPLCSQACSQLSNLKTHFRNNHKGIEFYDVYERFDKFKPKS